MFKRQQTILQKIKVSLLSWGFIAATVSLSSPLDFVRFRIQVMRQLMELGHLKTPYNGGLDCARRILKEEGIRAFWKGNLSSLIRLVPSETLIFLLKEQLQKVYHYHHHLTETQHVAMNTIIGVTSSFIVSFALYPLEYTRQQMANRTDNTKIKLWTLFKDTVQKHGFRELYHGANVFLYGLLAFRGLYFGLYDSLKVKTEDEKIRWCYSYISMYLAILLAYPGDSLRRRKITARKKYKNFMECARNIWRKQGLSGFYLGWQVVWVQNLSWCTFFFMYDRLFTDYSQALD